MVTTIAAVIIEVLVFIVILGPERVTVTWRREKKGQSREDGLVTRDK